MGNLFIALVSSLLHHVDYLGSVLLGQNLGPTGISPRTEKRNALV